MPDLLDAEMVQETSASHRRFAERLAGQIQRLEEQERRFSTIQQQIAEWVHLRDECVEAAEQSTDRLLARMAELEGIWKLVLNALQRDPLREDAEGLLSSALAIFESGRVLFKGPAELWKLVLALGEKSSRPRVVATAEQRLESIIAETRAALEHRRKQWKPADAERFARGLEHAREGKAVRAEDARARFARASE